MHIQCDIFKRIVEIAYRWDTTESKARIVWCNKVKPIGKRDHQVLEHDGRSRESMEKQKCRISAVARLPIENSYTVYFYRFVINLSIHNCANLSRQSLPYRSKIHTI